MEKVSSLLGPSAVWLGPDAAALIDANTAELEAKIEQGGGTPGPQGPPGKDGTNGKDGAAATITVGETVTLDPGAAATVTNTGTSAAAILNFGIPKGIAAELSEVRIDGIEYGTGVVARGAGNRATVYTLSFADDRTIDILDMYFALTIPATFADEYLIYFGSGTSFNMNGRVYDFSTATNEATLGMMAYVFDGDFIKFNTMAPSPIGAEIQPNIWIQLISVN